MINTRELEQQWIKYKTKRLLKPLLTLSLFFIAIIGATLFYNELDIQTVETNQSTSTPTEKYVSNINPTVAQPKITTTPKVAHTQTALTTTNPVIAPSVLNEPIEPTIHAKESTKEEKIVLTPSLNFLDSIHLPLEPVHDNTQHTTPPTYTQYERNRPVYQPTSQAVSPSTPKENNPPMEISISKRDEHRDLQDVIKRFKSNSSPALSLFIARQYYKNRNYQDAYNYALITNDLDSEIEESWIIFAKSLVKLQQKEMALRALDSYIKHTDSVEAKILRDNINKGTFK